MGTSMSRIKLYQQFRQEAKLVTIRSDTSTKNVIKWRGKLLMTGSLKTAFEEIKETMRNQSNQIK